MRAALVRHATLKALWWRSVNGSVTQPRDEAQGVQLSR